MSYNSYHFEDALPWSATEYDRRFVGIASVAFVIGNIIFALLAFMAAYFNPTIDDKELQLDQERLVKLVVERQAQPKPTPRPTPKPTPKVKSKPEPKSEPKAKPKPEPKPQPTAEQVKQKAIEKASNSGLLAMRDELADLRHSFSTESVKNQRISSNPGAAAGPNISTDSTAAVIASRAGQGSGGINTGNLGRSTGGGNLAGRSTTGVKSTLNSTGGGRGTGSGSGSANKRGAEEVELVFQQNRSAIDIIYNRYLRSDPSLKGKLVLELTISPNGSVTHVKVVSSQLANRELVDKIIARVKLFKFQSRPNVDTTTVNYPIDFLPS